MLHAALSDPDFNVTASQEQAAPELHKLLGMLPSLEALPPGLALTLAMCSVEYEDMQYVFNESYPPKSDGAASFCAASHSSNTTWGMFSRGSQLAFRMS